MSDGYELRRKEGRLSLAVKNEERSYPINSLSAVLLFGRGEISSESIELCAQKEVPISLLTKYYRIKAFVVPPLSSSSRERRLLQYELYTRERLQLAKLLVLEKIRAIEEVFSLSLETYKRAVEGAKDHKELMGYEGVVSSMMYESFKRLVPAFQGRNYKPAKDPVNALLSLSYSIAYNVAYAMLFSLGFDPYIAFLHNPRGTHAGFASDLIEPARPHLTRFVADIWKNFKSSDFEKADDAVFLRKEAMQTFLNLYSLQLQSLSDLMSQTLWKVFSDSQHVCQEEEG
jgi:CRISPR-associated protein Cas1